MGRGVVVGKVDDVGRYLIKIEFDQDRVDERIDYLTDIIKVYDEKLEKLKEEIIKPKEQLDLKAEALDVQIADLRAAAQTIDPETEQPTENYLEQFEKTVEAQIEVIKAAEEVNKIQVQIDLATLRREAASKEKLRLQKTKLKNQVIEAWSADFPSLDIDESGQLKVGLIEVNGERDKPLIIYPHYIESQEIEDSPVNYTEKRDGAISPSVALLPFGSYWNQAVMPGWQMWLPTYRLGTMVFIDYEKNTCTVEIDGAQSRHEDLPINKKQDPLPDAQNADRGKRVPTEKPVIYSNVPIWYMDCHALAFDIDDRVVVQFRKQDWEDPFVIGFEKEPVPCAIQGFLCHPTSETFADGIELGDNFINEHLLTYSEIDQKWVSDVRFEKLAGNIDWRGPKDAEGNQDILTWWGVPGRYNDLSASPLNFEPFEDGLPLMMGTTVREGTTLRRATKLNDSGTVVILKENIWNNQIYKDGRVYYQSAWPRIAGACFTKIDDPENQDEKRTVLIYAASNRTAPHREELFFLYDPIQQKERLLAEVRYDVPTSLTFNDENTTPWFFNESGTRAFAIRWSVYNPGGGERLSRWLYEFNFDGQNGSVDQTELADGITYTVVRTGGGPIEGGESNSQGVYEGKSILAADFIGDEPIFAYAIPSGGRNINYTWSRPGGPQSEDYSSSYSDSDIYSFRLECPNLPSIELYNFEKTEQGSGVSVTQPMPMSAINANSSFAERRRSAIGFMDLRFGIIEYWIEDNGVITSTYTQPLGGSASTDRRQPKNFPKSFQYWAFDSIRKSMTATGTSYLAMQSLLFRLAGGPVLPDPQIGDEPGVYSGLGGNTGDIVQYGGQPAQTDREGNTFWSGPVAVLKIERIIYSEPPWFHEYLNEIAGPNPLGSAGLVQVTAIKGSSPKYQPVRVV